MIRGLVLAIAYVGMIGALIWAMSLHHNVTSDLAFVILIMSGIVGLIIFVDETRQQRRKWRDHPNRRSGIFKEWNE